MNIKDFTTIIYCLWIVPAIVLFLLIYWFRKNIFNLHSNPSFILEEIKTRVKKSIKLPENVIRLHFIISSELTDPSREKIYIQIKNLEKRMTEELKLKDKTGSFAVIETQDFFEGSKFELEISYIGGHDVSLCIIADKKLSKKQQKLLLLGLAIIIIISLGIVFWYCRDLIYY